MIFFRWKQKVTSWSFEFFERSCERSPRMIWKRRRRWQARKTAFKNWTGGFCCVEEFIPNIRSEVQRCDVLLSFLTVFPFWKKDVSIYPSLPQSCLYRAKARACHLTKIQGWNANLFLLNLIWVDFSEFFTFSVWVTSFCFGERWICDEIQLWVVVVCLFLNHGCHLAATTKNMEKMQMISRRQGCDCSPRLWPWLWRRGFGRVRG